MQYILLVIWCFIPYLLFPLGVFAAVLLVRHFILKRKLTTNGSQEEDPAQLRLKKRIGTLNAIMITAVGLVMYRIVRDYVYFVILRPDRYALTSFPWYTNSLLYGAVALVVVVICLIIKLIINQKAKKIH